MSEKLNVVFCCDREMLHGLHVASMSVLQSLHERVNEPVFWVFSDCLDDDDDILLRNTLNSIGRPYLLHFREIDSSLIHQFPRLQGSLGTYFRLLVPEQIDAQRYIYLDVDILCKVDLSELMEYDLQGKSMALCPESLFTLSIDTSAKSFMGERAAGDYFNAGVMLVDRERWVEGKFTERCLEHLQQNSVDFYDQTAMNCVLHEQIVPLSRKFNLYANVRKNWNDFCHPKLGDNGLIHFVDWPKPWDRYARQFHMMGSLWWESYRTTAHWKAGQYCGASLWRQCRHWSRFKKMVKDRLLFALYNKGWIRPKGMN